MQLKINREYAVRHACVAALFLGLGLWFLYDAIFVYPNLPVDGPHHTTVEFQYSFAGLLLLATLIIAWRLMRNVRRHLTWTTEGLAGSLVGAHPVAWNDLTEINESKWKSKGILVVTTRTGKRFTLDAWHHQGVKELVQEIFQLPQFASAQANHESKA